MIGNKIKLQEIVGRELPDELFRFDPWGHRIVVAREEPVRVSPGGIVIPETAQERIAAGWVVSVGDEVGHPRPDFVGWSPYLRPVELIGRKILFGCYAGEALLLGGEANEYESLYVLMTDGDVWGVLNPKDNSTLLE